MSIKVNTYQLQSKSTYAASIASQLREKVDQVNNIYYSLDSKVKSRQGIGSSIRSLQNRIENAQRKMYNISRFLTTAANSYNTAEAVVAARGASIGSVSSASASAAAGTIKVGANTGAAQGKVEEKKWYQSNWFKVAVGAVVVGAAVALAVTVGGPILIAAAVGAAIGAGVGGITGGVVSKMNGGSFADGFSDGFMWGAIGGAASGAIGATGVGILGAAAAEGAVNAGVYVGQTMQNGGDVTVAGVATSFVVGAGFSAIGTVISNKISSVVSKNVDEVAKGMSTSSFGSNIDNVLSKYDISVDDFNNLRLKDVSELSDAEKLMMKSIRESVPMPDANTTMQKVIPASDVSKYIDGSYNQVGGYVTRAQDVAQLSNYDDIFNSLRLDYPGTQYNVGADDALGVIKFKTPDAGKIDIPYSKEMGGTVVGDPPFTGNGFTKATNGQIIPEYITNGRLEIADGAKLYEIGKDGVESLKAIYDKQFGSFVKVMD
jgi:hypothetical protein